jgi:GNAT superfamily N-acetyltransferase
VRLSFARATAAAAPALAALYNAVADDLTTRFGRGHWSAHASERGALFMMRTGTVIVARARGRAIAAFRLATKKPWAIDTSYFAPSKTPLYLLNMAVDPEWQRRGIGMRCLDEAFRIARGWPADAIRLDAYDAAAGAGTFYEKCGFRETGRVTYRKVPLIYYERLPPF